MTRKKIEKEQATPVLPEDDQAIVAESETPVAEESVIPTGENAGSGIVPDDDDKPLLLSDAQDADPPDESGDDLPDDQDGEHPPLPEDTGADPPANSTPADDQEQDPSAEGAEETGDGNDPAGADLSGGDQDGEASGGDGAPSAGTQDADAVDEQKPRRRTTRKKKAEEDAPEGTEPDPASAAAAETSKPARKKRAAAQKPESEPAPAVRKPSASVLTIENRAEVETPEDREELVWHKMQNALRTRRILSGILGGIETTENHNIIAVIYYKELRVVIPVSEMMIQLSTEPNNYGEMGERQSKILNNMLGCEIDFVVRGIDARTRSVVASRREAMLRKRKTFYLQPDLHGQSQIHEGRVVQARVIAVATKVVRVEVFGVETSILAKDLSWEWIGDAHERYMVGDEILIRIRKVDMESLEKITIEADVRSVTENSVLANLKKCKVQGKYAGTVTDIHKGVVFVRLAIGVNAIAHSCFDNRMPAKQDDVSFAVTHIDEDRGVAMGIITRIIKQRI